MKQSFFKIFIVALLLCVTASVSWAGHPHQPIFPMPQKVAHVPLKLSSRLSGYDVMPYVRVFRNETAKVSFSAVLEKYAAGQGIVVPRQDSFLLKEAEKGHWLVFGVHNRTASKSQWVLDFGNRMAGTLGAARSLQVFTTIDPEHALLHGGGKVKNKHHVEGQKRNAVPLTFEPGTYMVVGIYIKAMSGVPLALKLHLEEQSSFMDRAEQRELEHSILVFITLAVGLFLFAFVVHYRKEIPALLLMYLISQYFIYTSIDELVSFGNNTPITVLPLLYALSAFVMVDLARHILTLSSKKVDVLLSSINGVIIAAFVSSYVFDGVAPYVDIFYIRILPVMVGAVISLLGIRALLRGDAVPVVYTFAWCIYLAGAVLAEFSLLRTPFSTAGSNFYWTCFTLHFGLLAFAALRFMILTDEQEKSEQGRYQQQQEEELAMRRTKEEANQTRLLGVLQREKELMADVRNREIERIQALRHAKDVADQANKAKSDFLAVISHEIRTPMTGLMGMIRLLLDTQMDEKQQEYAKTIQYSGDALLALLNDILDLSKAEEGKMTLEVINFESKKLIESVILLMSGRAEEKGVALEVEFSPDTPDFLKGDPTRLRQILLNLISNSLKFTETGSVTVTIRPHDNAGRKPRYYFSVTDTGIGIPEEAQAKLFTPYTQADASITRQFGGTGLGLSICKRLVEAMGGSIQLESKEGEGTTFYFILPFETGESAEAALTGGDVFPLKILVVDDNAINLRVVAGFLGKDGHNIVTVNNAKKALDAMNETLFDVVLMDIEMPSVDGFEATKLIRLLPNAKKSAVPVVAMTGNVRREDVERCRAAGMQDHMSKPINPEVLRKLMSRYGPTVPSFTRLVEEDTPIKMEVGPDVGFVPPVIQMPVVEEMYLFDVKMLGDLKSSFKDDAFQEVVEDLYQKADELIMDAESGVAANNVEVIALSAHNLRGMAANFGLTELAATAEQLERKAKDGWTAEKLANLVGRMRPIYEETREMLDAWIKQIA